MSNDLKIKDINNKLEDKLQTSSWKDFLVPYIQGVAHKNFMTVLLDDMAEGIKFQPGLKDWFTEFYKVKLTDVKLIVISPSYELPFSTDDETFHLVTKRTANTTSEESHEMYWNTFNEVFMEFLVENKIHIPVVFIHKDTYRYSKFINEQFKKYYLPELTSIYWQDEEEMDRLKKNINIVLKSNQKNEINW
jgi:uracil DNA glycosylase